MNLQTSSILQPISTNNREIVFIDRGVEDYEFLAKGVRSGIEVHLLEADAMVQMTAVLSERKGLKAVHVVSHGAPGCLYLGEGELSLSRLGQNEAQLRAWFSGYAEGEKPELLLYGCNVAAGDAGEEFLSRLARLTGVIALASRGKVGAPKAGGVWRLDYGQRHSQPVELFSIETQRAYSAAFAPGDLDTSFGNGGVVTTDINHSLEANADTDRSWDTIGEIAIDTAGNIIVYGTSNVTPASTPGRPAPTSTDLAFARYTNDGQLDTSFGNSGKVEEINRNSLPLRNIVSAGNTLFSSGSLDGDFGLARYTSNGQLDTSFGSLGGGRVTTDFNGNDDVTRGIATDAAGNILLAGYSGDIGQRNFALARYTQDGQLDSSFGIGGKVTTNLGDVIENINTITNVINDITLDVTGNILVTGYLRTETTINGGGSSDLVVARYTSNGQLDSSFGIGGTVITNFNEGHEIGYDIDIDSAGNIIVLATSDLETVVLRYGSTGQLDTSFGTAGKVTPGFVLFNHSNIATDTAGNILIAGLSDTSDNSRGDLALFRYDSTGQLDTSFNEDGKASIDFNGGEIASIAIDAAGDILVAGRADGDFAIAKFEGTAPPPLGIAWNTETGVVSSAVLEVTTTNASFNPTDRTITDTKWALQTIGDLDNDGQDDVLLRHATSGQNLALYLTPGSQSIKSEALIGRNVEDSNWSIVGTGDFNADGKTDIIWQNQAADQILAWYMDGQGNIEDEARIGRDISDSDWKIEAVADFSGDGKADMLLRNGTSGQIILWEMDGETIIEESLLGREVSDINWVIEGARDFDNNGTMDVLLRNAAAEQTVLWSMVDKTTIGSESMISNMPGADSQIVF